MTACNPSSAFEDGARVDVDEQCYAGSDGAEALRARCKQRRPGNLGTALEIHAREPADGARRRDGDDTAGRDLCFGKPRRGDAPVARV